MGKELAEWFGVSIRAIASREEATAAFNEKKWRIMSVTGRRPIRADFPRTMSLVIPDARHA